MTEGSQYISQENEPSSFRLISALGIAGFLAGLILVSVYLYTKPIIAKNKAEALKAAIFEVLPGTASYKAFELDGNLLKELDRDTEGDEERIYLGLDETGRLTGFAIPGGEPGYQDVIAGLVGYDPNAQLIIGFKVLDSKETPGLGDKIYKDEDFQVNFTKLAVEPEVELVKKGRKTSDNQVEAITGATISSKAIVRLLNNSMAQWRDPINQYLTENKDANGE